MNRVNTYFLGVLTVLVIASCRQGKNDEPSTAASNEQENPSSVSVSSPLERLQEARGQIGPEDDNEIAIIGDMAEEKYLLVSGSRVESVGIESVFFYDISGDGVPELWMVTDDCEALRMVLVYSLSDWDETLYQGAAGHSLFYAGKNYVIRQSAHMGNAYWYRLQWRKGRMESEMVFEEFTVDDYLLPDEEPVGEIFPKDLNPHHLLKWKK